MCGQVCLRLTISGKECFVLQPEIMVDYQALALSKKLALAGKKPIISTGCCVRGRIVGKSDSYLRVVNGKFTEREQIRRWYTLVFIAGSTDGFVISTDGWQTCVRSRGSLYAIVSFQLMLGNHVGSFVH